MKEETCFIITEPKGAMLLSTIKPGKRECINEFIKDSKEIWGSWYSYGWRCKKVKISLTSHPTTKK